MKTKASHYALTCPKNLITKLLEYKCKNILWFWAFLDTLISRRILACTLSCTSTNNIALKHAHISPFVIY